jgi:spoIIIJ-associated protein
MLEIEFRGKTVEEAINNGLSQLGCKKEDIAIKIVSEGTTGLFGLMGAKPAIVLISVDDSKCTNKITIDVDSKKICKKVEFFLSEILCKMNIALNKIECTSKDNIINVNIISTNSFFIIGENGQTLNSLEYIVQIIVNKEFNSKFKINLDCQNYRKKQEEKLIVMINNAIDYVNSTGKTYYFDPMNTKERKIIHSYLKDNNTVESFSEGTGYLKKVGIKLLQKKSS